ncbi:hypothetical protein ACLQ29_00090 [Micromonospora sp. DT228]|uniref:hypothetical protein n=1 Tax=Micromonospora sp. DT228 TaxID=3393443 RepID=UPI003CF8A57B
MNADLMGGYVAYASPLAIAEEATNLVANEQAPATSISLSLSVSYSVSVSWSISWSL